jgi:acyl carrier protein
MSQPLRKALIDWRDDNYHFGDAEALIGGDDDKSFLQNGILSSLGFVELLLFLEKSFGVRIERKDISPVNFDSLRKIMTFVLAMPAYRGPK